MNCHIHSEKEAAGACVYCGKFFCSDCLVDVNGKSYCREHVSAAFNEQQTVNQSVQPSININNVNTNTNTNTTHGGGPNISSKSRLVAALLCFFLGYLGIHRFYAGKIGTGILYLLTGGFCGIGALIDFILILVGSFNDNYGFAIKNW